MDFARTGKFCRSLHSFGGGGGADVEAGLAEYKSSENEHSLGPVKKRLVL